jgi:hypothetical protein
MAKAETANLNFMGIAPGVKTRWSENGANMALSTRRIDKHMPIF